MVTIIGHVDDIVKQATCHGCGHILEYRKPDIKWGSTREYTSKNYQYVECPFCKDEYADNPNIEEIGRVKVND